MRKNGKFQEEMEQGQWVRDRRGEDVADAWLATAGCSKAQEVALELEMVDVEEWPNLG